MPNVQCSILPAELFRYLVRRVEERSITKEDLPLDRLGTGSEIMKPYFTSGMTEC
jgi:hypothetical protein